MHFGGALASITYHLKAGAETFWRGEHRKVIDAMGIMVVESPPLDKRGEDVGVVAVGEGGKVWTHARILDSFVVAGQNLTCRLHVKNNSQKKVQYLSSSCRLPLIL